MEYVTHRGVYSDLPLDEIILTFDREYRQIESQPGFVNADFDADVASETA
jgi:hypothetical protein